MQVKSRMEFFILGVRGRGSRDIQNPCINCMVTKAYSRVSFHGIGGGVDPQVGGGKREYTRLRSPSRGGRKQRHKVSQRHPMGPEGKSSRD